MHEDATATVDKDFLEARSKLLDVAAYLDRVDRLGGQSDYRHQALMGCLAYLLLPDVAGKRVRTILETLSDTSTEPIVSAGTQGASGAPLPH